MYDVEATIIIIAFSLALSVFVGAIAPAIYGWSTFFLCIGVFTLFYTLLKKASGWR